MWNKVIDAGNELALALVPRQSTVPFTTPHTSTLDSRLGRQLAVFMVFVGILLGLDQSASAMVCEIDTSEAPLMSAVAEPALESPVRVFAPARVLAAPPVLQCDALNQDDCEINQPEGEPQAPQTSTRIRPNAALGNTQGKLPSANRSTIATIAILGACRPGHPASLFRPPRSR